MKYRILPTAEALHKIAAHSHKLPNGRKIGKGTTLSQQDIADLQVADIHTIAAAELESGDVAENEAAAAVADAICGGSVSPAAAVHGRVNVHADCAGVLCYVTTKLQALNLESEAITLAALPPFARTTAGQIIATIKIIPYAAPQTAVAAMRQYAQLLCIRPFQPKTAVLLQTEHSTASPNILDKTRNITEQRLAIRGCSLIREWRCPHETQSVMATLEDIRRNCRPDITLLAGASAVCDIADVIPAAVTASGGSIARFGMPADPGNLLVLGEWQNAPCIILPGCARSPKYNGLDMVLDRLLAELPLSTPDIAAMGAGGLLEDTTARPMPRRPNTQKNRPRIGALLLAAGTSSRMHGTNKLLTPWRGKPLIRHAAETLAAARRQQLIQQSAAVCGKDAAAVIAEIAGLDLPSVINRDYESGMASSIVCGLRTLDLQQLDGVLVLLGDMPQVTADDIAAVVRAFAAEGNLTAATHRNKRGNPVLFGQRHFAAMLNLQGDAGARVLFGEEPITEAAASAGVLFDLDSPESFADEPKTQNEQSEQNGESGNGGKES